MKLEEYIKNTDFKNEEEKLIVNFVFTYNWLKEFQMKLFKPYGLTTQQYNILRILRSSSPDPLSMKTIKERMLEKMSDTSRLIVRLKKKRLISCVTNHSDRRNLDITINQNGLKVLAEIDKALPVLRSIVNRLSIDEIKTANNIFDKLRSGKLPGTK